jgi:ssDNA-binding Zn-finger/Zn-ribbon topoisomerase 1
MADVRECPLCGGSMRLKQSETVVQIPGNPKSTSRTTAEWVCPDCDYFEEAEDAGSRE